MIMASLSVGHDQYSVVSKFARLQVPLAYPLLLFHQVVLCLLHLPYFGSAFFSSFRGGAASKAFTAFLKSQIS